ncbi:ABC transporter F family member 4 [Fagus crenata]
MSGKDISKEGKKEKLSVLEMLSSIEQKPDKPKMGSSSSSVATSSKTETKSCTKRVILQSYTNDIDLPPSDDENDNYASEEELTSNRQQRSELKPLDISKEVERLQCGVPLP